MSLDADNLKFEQLKDKMDSPIDYLGIHYESYCNSIYSLSLSQPTEYYAMRNLLLKDLNTELLENTHATVFNILRYGQLKADGVNYTNKLKPNYPAELCNQISMSIAESYQVEVKKIIQILLPPDYESLAKSSMSSKTLAQSIDRPTPPAV